MCDLSNGFRLCTCAADQPFNWVVERLPEGVTFRGICALDDQLTEDQELTRLFLEEGLQQSDCFDVDYRPAAGDRLTFLLGNDKICFLFYANRWNLEATDQYDGRTRLHHGQIQERPRSQHV